MKFVPKFPPDWMMLVKGLVRVRDRDTDSDMTA